MIKSCFDFIQIHIYIKTYCIMEKKKFKLWPPIAILNYEGVGEYIVKLFGITVYYRVTWK